MIRRFEVVLLSCCPAVLLSCCAAVLLSCCAAVLLSCCGAVLLCPEAPKSTPNHPRRLQNRPPNRLKNHKKQKIDPGASRRAKKCVLPMSGVAFWRKMSPQGGQMGPEIDQKIEKIGTKSQLFSREGPGVHFGAFGGRK